MLYFFMVSHKAACQTLLKASGSLRRRGRGLAGVGDISHLSKLQFLLFWLASSRHMMSVQFFLSYSTLNFEFNQENNNEASFDSFKSTFPIFPTCLSCDCHSARYFRTSLALVLWRLPQNPRSLIQTTKRFTGARFRQRTADHRRKDSRQTYSC